MCGWSAWVGVSQILLKSVQGGGGIVWYAQRWKSIVRPRHNYFRGGICWLFTTGYIYCKCICIHIRCGYKHTYIYTHMHNINTFEGGAGGGGDWLPTLHQKRLSKSLNLRIAGASGFKCSGWRMSFVSPTSMCPKTKLHCKSTLRTLAA